MPKTQQADLVSFDNAYNNASFDSGAAKPQQNVNMAWFSRDEVIQLTTLLTAQNVPDVLVYLVMKEIDDPDNAGQKINVVTMAMAGADANAVLPVKTYVTFPAAGGSGAVIGGLLAAKPCPPMCGHGGQQLSSKVLHSTQGIAGLSQGSMSSSPGKTKIIRPEENVQGIPQNNNP